MAAGLNTDFIIGRFYSVEEVLQAELRQALAKGSSTELMELKALEVKLMSQPLQISMKSIRRIFRTILESYNDIINRQHKIHLKMKNFSRFVEIKNYGIPQ
jgi:nucleoid DNA-binding protein